MNLIISLITPIIIFVVFLFFLILLIIFFSSIRFTSKGERGESRVADELSRLNGNEYIVMNDVLIKTSRGSSQIDHIVISTFGIFVIETKNYNGWIFGDERSEYWTQIIYKQKSKFRNPIKQNWSHIFALKEVFIDYRQIKYFPIVVFTGRGELKKIRSKIPVIYINQLIEVIVGEKENSILSPEHIRNIVDRLNEINNKEPISKEEHINRVRESINHRKELESDLICPRCGGYLVLREGSYGKFYGCSNYPNCRHKLKYWGW